MAGESVELRLTLAGDDLDDEALEECASLLADELAQLDVDEVAPAADGAAPAGTKGVELVALGALVVKLARSRKLLGQVVEAVRDWMSRANVNSVRMQIGGDVLEISSVSESERKALIDTWVQRHAGG